MSRQLETERAVLLLRRRPSLLRVAPPSRVLPPFRIAVAAFLAFTQCNVTGPLKEMAKCPLALKKVGCGKGEDEEWDNWARNQLMAAGSDLLGKFSNLQYLVFAKMLLTRTRDLLFGESVSSTYGISSISWWLARFIFLQQRILDERSSSLFDLLHVYAGETLHHFDTLEKVTSYFGSSLHNEDALAIISMVHLEAGIMEYTYGRVDSCRCLSSRLFGLEIYFKAVHHWVQAVKVVSATVMLKPTSTTVSASIMA